MTNEQLLDVIKNNKTQFVLNLDAEAMYCDAEMGSDYGNARGLIESFPAYNNVVASVIQNTLDELGHSVDEDEFEEQLETIADELDSIFKNNSEIIVCIPRQGLSNDIIWSYEEELQKQLSDIGCGWYYSEMSITEGMGYREMGFVINNDTRKTIEHIINEFNQKYKIEVVIK